MYALYMTKGTWLYCSRACLEAGNPDMPRNIHGMVDSSQFIPDYDTFSYLADHGWTDSKCDKCGAPLFAALARGGEGQTNGN